ncbi:MAG TPA: ABC transporter substrate-binding protein [Methylomirabilota bacterium]|nr:ABC transporter substrate-binding protein [Methylomirabilota bacterium]
MLGRVLLAAVALLSSGAGARAESIHLSHFGEVMQSIPWAVALEQKLFQKNGADVTDVISSQGGGTTIRNMLAGGLGFGASAGGATVTAIQSGLPVKIVGVDNDSLADILWVVPDASPLKTIKDVKGKKFGTTTPGALTYILGELLLKQNGLDYKAVTPVPVGTGAGLAALDSGAVDATYEYEPLFSRDEGKYRVLGRVADIMPRVAILLLVATQDMIDKHPDQLRAIMATHKEAVDFVYAHPKEAADVASKRMVGVNQAVVERAVARLVKDRYWSEGGFDPKAMDALQQVLQMTGEVKGAVDFKAIADQRFLPAGVPRLQ